jgi:4a-hydroxytetrahydrobiopterin dehydratase
VYATGRIEVCIDCAQPELLRPFWLAALGYRPDPTDVRAMIDPAGLRPPVWLQQVPEAKTLKNRVHLDIYFDGEAGATERRDRLIELGGIALARHPDFWLMADPEGNEFCLCWSSADETIT